MTTISTWCVVKLIYYSSAGHSILRLEREVLVAYVV